MWKLAAALPVLVACSGGAPAPGTSESTAPGPVERTADGRAGVAIEAEGDLGGCEPVGVWRARGSFPGTGDCAELPEAVEVELEVIRAGGGYRLVLRGAGEVTGDRLAAARGGGCALGFTVRRGDDRLFAHLVDGGDGGARGRGALDRYSEGGELACTADVVFVVER